MEQLRGTLTDAFMRAGHLILHETTLPPSAEWTIDFPGWLFARVMRGLGYVLGGGLARELEAGQVVISCTLQPTVFRASTLGEIHLHWFRLCPELLTGFFTLHEEHYLQTVAPQKKSALRVLPASHETGKRFAGLSSRNSAGNPLLVRAEMLALMAQVLEHDLSIRGQRRNRVDAGERFKEVVASAPAATIENSAVSDLARQCGCSERHFNRLFRSHFGFSLRARQTEARLQKVQRLLRESKLSIGHAAIQCGFHHLPLFNALFKRRFGMTPSEWREQSPTESVRERRRSAAMEIPRSDERSYTAQSRYPIVTFLTRPRD